MPRYSYASLFQIQAAVGASFAKILGIGSGLEAGVFYVAWQLSILVVNLFPVKVSQTALASTNTYIR